jgi:hypothetical protein
MKTRSWRCRYCGKKVQTPASTWPAPEQDPRTGHFCFFERAIRGRPREDPVEESAEASDRVEVDEEDEGITVRRVIPKTGRCLDCGTAIRAISKRCRPCAGKEWGRRAKAEARAARVLRERQKR